MSEPNVMSDIQDKELTALGIEKPLRRNLVIGIIVIQFGAIGYLFQNNNQLQREIIQIKTAQVDSSNAQYARLLSKVEGKLAAVQNEAREISTNISTNDSLNNKLRH